MNSNMYIPFTYHICWSKENLHYYGVKFAKGCHPNDLWTKYFTSSDKVRELREQYGEPDVIEVRKEFKSKEEAKDWEIRVLGRLGADKRNDWINQVNVFPAYDRSGCKHSLATKKKMSMTAMGNKNALGFKHTKETKKKMSDSAKGNTAWLGKTHSNETKKKLSEIHTGKVLSKEHCQKLSEAHIGHHHSTETKQKMADSAKKRWKHRKRKKI